MNDYNLLHVDSFDENCWSELIDYGGLLDEAVPPTNHYWNPQPPTQEGVVAIDASLSGTASLVSECAEEQECRRKRGRSEQCGGTGTKACRERMRREKLNERFSELSATLEPGRPMKTDKSALLGDAIRVLNQLKTESQEYKEMNEKLLEEIKTLKAEKNELREEKLVLKADKERIEQQLKTLAVSPTGFMPAPPSIFQAGANKMPMFPSYSYVPMWQYLPPSARDTSQDHQLRPPAA
ncbi:transcription factor bhlh104 [Phtheirospermum japonicum]|uniref:Transcription factor bhlh104 n=1 Tax=Phtheirospermum japonicum TaxID=374723 RepID=A0A830BNF9_9LAMI|nr:transcription factor bhlh104 [Phtheirospermum japonicum]